MATYDSDSSLSDADTHSSVGTNVLLGYASKEPTDDSISQLGGEPSWLDRSQPPSAGLAHCRSCNNHLALLLQLNADLPERFPRHERRLYVWACRRKTCRRKEGSIRIIRGVRVSKQSKDDSKIVEPKKEDVHEKIQPDIGATLFGGSSSASSSSRNPFASTSDSSNPFSVSSSPSSANHFAATTTTSSTTTLKPSQSSSPSDNADTTANLPETFAQKARISDSTAPSTTTYPAKPPATPSKQQPHIPWPTDPTKLPKPYPSYYLDADYEYLSPQHAEGQNGASTSASHAAFMDVENGSTSGGRSTEKEDAMLYEDALDRTFQRFADVLAQNPEQVLRYEFNGVPLLYSRTDAVGRLFPSQHAGGAGNAKVTIAGGADVKHRLPRCGNCGSERVFECQLTPHAIAELEAEEEGATLLGEGMEWGTILVGVCSADCGGNDEASKVGYVEEWAGVQWEEVVDRKPSAGASKGKGK